MNKARVRLILASASPRRRELLKRLGVPFTVVPSRIHENISRSAPAALARRLALDKALETASRLRLSCKNKAAWVLGADTLVVLGKKILNKPKDRAHARRMLEQLSGRTHKVITGLALVPLCPGKKRLVAHEATRVLFRRLSPGEIEAYLDHGEYRDKAGAYGIQGRASVFVEAVRGCYFNVVGLPLSRLGQMLKSLKAR